MTRFRPSLVRRLMLAFTFGPALVILLVLVVLRPVMLNLVDANAAPQLVLTLVAAEIRSDASGRLQLPSNGRVLGIASRSPSLWITAWRGTDAFSVGAAPRRLTASLRSLPWRIKQADFGDLSASDRLGDISVARTETSAGPLMIAVGGVPPGAISLGDWLSFAHHDSELYIGLLLLVVICMGGAPIAIPIILAALRPTTRAASQLDLAVATSRLPEHAVVKELLPLVRTVNAALQRVSDAFERRRRFIADVAHELRTPLAVLGMHVDALPTDRRKTDLQRAVFRLGQMIGQMLDAERFALATRRREAFDLVAVTRDAVAQIAPLAVANGYDLAHTTDMPTVVVQGDRHAIARAVANLLGNAVAHGGGHGTIDVRVTSAGAVEIADEGPGVAPEARDRIFDPFHRERWDRDGCGLGLYLVREIMKSHGGSVMLLDSPRGAVFRLSLPARQI